MLVKKEKIQVRTVEDKKTHEYFSALEIDKDVDAIVSNAILVCYYDPEKRKYWETIHSTVIIDVSLEGKSHNTFIGRVESVKQVGYNLEIRLQDAGWKFKTKVPKEFRKSYIAGQKVTDAFQAICEAYGLEFCYSITALNDYTFADDGYSIQKDGEVITDAPDEIKLLTGEDAKQLDKDLYEDNLGALDGTISNINNNTTPASNTISGGQKSHQDKQISDNAEELNEEHEKSDTEDLKEKIDKYQEDFDDKMEKLITGDYYYEDTDVVNGDLNYDLITIEPNVSSDDVSSSTPESITSPSEESLGTKSSNSGYTQSSSNKNYPTSCSHYYAKSKYNNNEYYDLLTNCNIVVRNSSNGRQKRIFKRGTSQWKHAYDLYFRGRKKSDNIKSSSNKTTSRNAPRYSHVVVTRGF